MITPFRKHLVCNNYQSVKYVFRISLYLWVIFNFAQLISNSDMYWGKSIYFNSPNFLGSFSEDVFGVLLSFPWLPPIAIIVASILGLLFSRSTLLGVLIYFLVIYSDNKAFPILDGGNNLSHLLLFYNCFFLLETKFSKSDECLVISNFAIFLCRFQVVMIYLVAGITKVTGSLWTKGVAFYYVLNSDSYSLDWMQKWSLETSDFFLVFPTYLVLLFQLCFPYLVWHLHFRYIILLLGMLIHLGIVFFMGLPSFGIIMCVSYICFLEKKFADKLLSSIFYFKKTFYYYKKALL